MRFFEWKSRYRQVRRFWMASLLAMDREEFAVDSVWTLFWPDKPKWTIARQRHGEVSWLKCTRV